MKRVLASRRLAALACCALVALPMAIVSSSSASTADQTFITNVCALPAPWISRILNGYRPDWSGDVYTIPSHVPHDAVAGPEGCTVTDVFAPVRADWTDLKRGEPSTPRWP